jgi:hypothetical protein
LGSAQQREATLNWDFLNIQSHDLRQLDDPLQEEEIRLAVFESPSEKAPSLDGFIGLFYKTCWEVIKDDLVRALN